MINTLRKNIEAQSKINYIGWMLLPISFLPLAALLTYDWRTVADLCIPNIQSTNWIGALGDGFAYYGYRLFGLSIWFVPLHCIWAGLLYLLHRRRNRGLRRLWLLGFMVALSCVFQLLERVAPGLVQLTKSINIGNSGGAIGYLFIDCFACRFIGVIGTTLITILFTIATMIASAGISNLIEDLRAIGIAVYDWCQLGISRIPRPAENKKGDSENTRDDADEEADEDDETENAAPAADAVSQSINAALAVKNAAKTETGVEKKEQVAAAVKMKTGRIAAPTMPEAAVRETPAVEPANEPAAKVEAPAPVAKPVMKLKPVNRAPISQPISQPVPQPIPPPPVEDEPEKPVVEDKGPYILPPLDLLAPVPPSIVDHSDVGETANRLVTTLKLFGVDASVCYTIQGPVITKYAIELTPGTRYSVVTNIQDNLKGALRAKSIRIEAPIPGEDCIGIEVPNRSPAGISFREIFESNAWKNARAAIPLLFGKDAAGHELVADLATMPHMLVAGATGQGKSVCLNSLICGLLMSRTPEQLKLIMVDPKTVEFTAYCNIPHLLVPVITDNRKVIFALHWAVAEMEKRLKLFSKVRVRNIHDYNNRPLSMRPDLYGEDKDIPRTVPYIVIIIDEVADLMNQCAKEVTPDISRLTAKARAAGIHLILATQRPDAKVITGTIKANIPGRVAFKTTTGIDSRTILDESGAENLIGCGDMLFKTKDGTLIRAQGSWISDPEIERITEFIEQHSNTQFDETFATKLGRVKEDKNDDPFADNEDDPDNNPEPVPKATARELAKAADNADDFKKAIECLINTRRASVSHFQRQMKWGYNHAANILDMLTDRGIVSPQQGMGPRQIIMDQDQLTAILNEGTTTDSSDVGAGDAVTPSGASTNDLGDDLAKALDNAATFQEES